MIVYLVTCDCAPWVLGGYTRAEPAHTHARTITGAGVLAIQILETLPEIVLESLGDDFDDAPDTPVTSVPIDELDDSKG